MSSFAQLRLLLWKSAKTAWRSPVFTLCEILMPFMLLYILNLLRTIGISDAYPEGLTTISRTGGGSDHYLEMGPGQLFRYTSDKKTNTSIKEFCAQNSCQLLFENPGTWNVDQEIHVFNQTALDVTVFDGDLFTFERTRKKSSDDFHYDIPTDRDSRDNADLARFLGSFAKRATNISMPIIYNMLPTPQQQSRQGPRLLFYTEILLLLALLPTLAAINVAREIAVEKESSMKDYLLVMGMTRVTYYTHHLLWALIKSLPAIIGVSWMIMIDAPVLGIHFLLIFTLFVAAEISLATLIPALIKRPTIATLCAFVLIPFNALLGVTMPVPRSSILFSSLSSLSPGHAMAAAFDTIREAVLRGNTISWIADARYVLPYGALVLIMIFDIVLYVSFAMLIDVIGSSTENIFARCKRAVTSDDSDDVELSVHEQDPSLESEEVDVELIDVHKTYSSGERAVRGVSMKLLRGQVTVLLGHNGAGKSTTFAMIAGITVPTAGTIRIGAASEKADRRSIIGYCPQYNPIFPKLTVSEHLQFFAELKGLTNKSKYTKEGERLMNLLVLSEKSNERAASLSGGMKRKLSIAISLIGNSKVVLLDEPTAGVDAGARRDIERLLAAQKKERTFLLTTHYTDEAEHLGDRVMIMAGGKLVCSGSPHFLQREFGAGYILSCVAKDSSKLEDTAAKTLKLAEEYVGNVKLERQHGQQFEIWLDKERSERFPALFHDLETCGDVLGIESYGLSNNTLEQVFLRVGELTGITRQAKVKEALGVLLRENDQRSAGPISYLKRFGYLQLKRLLYELCELRSVLINLLPILVFIYSIGSITNTIEKGVVEINDETLDPLRIPRCMRLSIDESLMRTDWNKLKLDDALKESLPLGSCILFEETPDINSWYEKTAMTRRPPILATIARHPQEGGLLVRMAPSALHYTSALHIALVRAVTNTSFTITARNQHRPQFNYHELANSGREESKDSTLRFVSIAVFLLLQPILMYRSIGFYVVETTVKFTHQQLLTGLPRWFYWISSFFSDLVVFSLNYSFAVGCCVYFDVLTEELWRLTPLCFLIFCVSQVKCYILQCVFESKAKAENLTLVFLILSYLTFACAYAYQYARAVVNNAHTREGFTGIYECILLLDPHLAVVVHEAYPLLYALRSKALVFGVLTAQFTIVLSIFLLIEFGPTIMQAINRRKAITAEATEQNSTPLLELGARPVLEVSNLFKRYGNNFAVNGISFGVEQHECFGLLGVNGAGKTSTFEVLTGSATATSGTATVAGVDCSTPARIGYCPQFDALLEELSGRQNLVVLAALHGYRNPGVVADTVIECVGMSGHANKKSKSYSGGQRRKISVAAALGGYQNVNRQNVNEKKTTYRGHRGKYPPAALLAQNSLIILDEPTAGIDPVTRRDIWSVICALRDSTNTAIVLTSHSMEEVEALCSRIAILRKGEIVAQGSSQSLKSAYGNNFKLTLVVEDKAEDEVQGAVHNVFPLARKINGASENVHMFEIPRDPRSVWSSMFSTAIDLARQLQAKDYCLSQASLEDAFIALTSGSEVFNYPCVDNGVNHSNPNYDEPNGKSLI